MIQPPSCLDVPPSMFCPGVFTSVLLQHSAPPPPRSLIFHPLHPLTAVEKAGCSTYFKQGGSQRRRSSHLIPATGLRRSHKHVGLLSCFFSQFGKKKGISISESTKFFCCFESTEMVRANKNKTNIQPECGPGRQRTLGGQQKDSEGS